jgi:hypothetical protein
MDAYDLQARHAPVVLTLCPLVLLAAVLIPEFQSSIALPAAFAATAVAGVYALLSRVARARGRQLQERLYRRWGGLPTTYMLRHRDLQINTHTKERYHAGLRALGAVFVIPTAAEEEADPAGADARYASAVDEIRRRAKRAGDVGVRRENISYGFTRNLLALKPLGLLISLGCLAALSSYLFIRGGGSWAAVRPIEIALTAFFVIDLLAWLLLVTPALVKQQAEAYATALFETIEA